MGVSLPGIAVINEHLQCWYAKIAHLKGVNFASHKRNFYLCRIKL